VSVEGNSDEEDVSERYLGRILASKDDDDNNKAEGKGRKAASKKAEKKDSSDEGRTRRGAAKVASDDEKTKSKAAQGKVTPPKQAAKTAHKRGGTQAKATSQHRPARKYGTRATRRQNGGADDTDLFVGGIDKVQKKPKAPAAPKVGSDETVIKVKMLTGTLYIYRGANPRAEFIRVV
jgi:hypothetical protein